MYRHPKANECAALALQGEEAAEARAELSVVAETELEAAKEDVVLAEAAEERERVWEREAQAKAQRATEEVEAAKEAVRLIKEAAQVGSG